LSTAESVALVMRVAEGLAVAHAKGIVHRDLKPANVMLVGGDVTKPKLLDFGIAREPGSGGLTETGMVLGTPGYMAPEQARGEQADRRADVYGLAVVAFEMLTGTRLFAAPTAAELLRATVEAPLPAARDRWAGVPAGLDGALFRGLARSPNRRYGSAMELLWALAPVLEGRPQRRPLRPARLPPMPLQRPTPEEEIVFIPSVLTGAPGEGPGGDERLEEVEPSA